MPFEIDIDVERVTVDGVHDVRDLAILSAKQGDNSLLIEIAGEATVDLDVWVRRSDAVESFPEEDFGNDIGGGLVSLWVSADIEVIVEAIYQRNEIRVETIDRSVLGH